MLPGGVKRGKRSWEGGGASRTLRGAGCCVTKWGVDLVVGSDCGVENR